MRKGQHRRMWGSFFHGLLVVALCVAAAASLGQALADDLSDLEGLRREMPGIGGDTFSGYNPVTGDSFGKVSPGGGRFGGGPGAKAGPGQPGLGGMEQMIQMLMMSFKQKSPLKGKQARRSESATQGLLYAVQQGAASGRPAVAGR